MINQNDLGLFLARVKLPKKTKNEPACLTLLRNFESREILKCLKGINMSWYVTQLKKLLEHPKARSADKLAVLDRIQELILLGALQDPEMSTALRASSSVKKEPKRSDIFAGDEPLTLKVRKA